MKLIFAIKIVQQIMQFKFIRKNYVYHNVTKIILIKSKKNKKQHIAQNNVQQNIIEIGF